MSQGLNEAEIAEGWRIPVTAVGWVLLALGLLKCLSVFFSWTLLSGRNDPVLGLPMNRLMLATGIVESGWGVLILRVLPLWGGGLAAVGMAQAWLIYQWLHAYQGNAASCPCLGQAPIWFPWVGRYERQALLAITIWVFCMGWGLLARGLLQRANRTAQ